VNRKIAIGGFVVAGIAAISLTACGPAKHNGYSASPAHKVTLGNVGVAGGTVPAADCAVSLTAKGITAYLDFHGTVDGLTASSQCHELTKAATRQKHVTVTQVTDIPTAYKSVCSATSAKGYTVTVYSDNALSDAAGKQFCKAFAK
jgi:hypothetical protein